MLFLPLIPLFFLGLWTLVVFVVSRMGWRSFSNRYPAPSRPPGQAYSSPRSWFGSSFGSYRNVVRVVFTEAGVYFYTMVLFRTFHPPFLVPWASIRRIEKENGFGGERYRLDVEDAAGEIHVLLPTTIENELFRYRNAV